MSGECNNCGKDGHTEGSCTYDPNRDDRCELCNEPVAQGFKKHVTCIQKEEIETLKKAICSYAREELGNMCFETDQEIIEYFISHTKEKKEEKKVEAPFKIDSRLTPCPSISPDGTICQMALGHFGPHKKGELYHPEISWVEECEDECVFHENIHNCSAPKCTRNYGKGRFLECINCGTRKNLDEDDIEYEEEENHDDFLKE